MPDSGPPPDATEQHTVSGTLTFDDGTPASGVRVIASARRLRSLSPLGETVTGPGGRYRIAYPATAIGAAPAELVVTAATNGPDGGSESVRQSPGRDETVDLTVPADGTSEYDRLLAVVSPLLEGASLTELRGAESDRDDIAYLARATGRPAAQVGYLVLADRHAAATGLAAELFYGVLRQGLPADLSTLAGSPVGDVRAALTAAAAAGVIGPVSAEAAAGFAGQLRAREVAAFVQGTTVQGATGTPSPVSPVSQIAAAAVPDAAIRERIYDAYLDHDGGFVRFWARLKADEQTAPHVDRLRLALQLGAMTGNNTALVKKLLLRFDQGELTHPRELAALDDAAWSQLIEDTGGVPGEAASLLAATGEPTAAETGQPPTNVGTAYRDLVAGLVAEAYPTAHIHHRLAASDASAPAVRFLDENPEFDLLTTPVSTVSVPDEPARTELAAIQRLTKLTPAFDAVQTLRARGFDSAHSIARAGQDAFAAQVADALPPEQAAAVHARATHVHAAAVNLIADLRTATQFDVPWLAAPPERQAMLAQIPNWEELFGSPDYCACTECQSVHGQPAYLADLMLFLRSIGLYGDPPPEGSEGSVADALYRRRPDLWDVELSCDNTNLPLPYVDLVNELLETVIVERSTKVGAKQRQTSGDPARLRVQPQHVNPAAYEAVRKAVYPWSLPFDLWADQTRTSLAHLGVRRDRLMAVLRPSAADDVAVSVEELGLPSVAGRIITGQPLSPGRTLAEFYGHPADTTADELVDDLSQVRHMLDTAGLRYSELVEVLDTRFVNPGGAIQIVSDDPDHPCDTNLMSLRGLDFYALDRLHRFVRLQRALAGGEPGRSAVELDRVLMASNNQGRLDAAGLRSVLAVRRLAARLDLAADEVLAFYGPLPTHRYATATEPPLYDRLFLDPSVVTLPPGQASPFELNAARTELRVVGSLVDPAVTAALLGILEVTDAELAALVTGRRSVTPNRLLNLANLSALFRTVRLARALGLSIEDLLRLIELYGGGGPFPVPPEAWYGGEPELPSGIPMRLAAVPLVPPPVGGGDPELTSGGLMRPPAHPDGPAAGVATVDTSIGATERFLDAVAEILARGFTVAELDAVLTATLPAHDGPLPDDTALAATLTTLRTALQAVYQQTAQTSDEKGELTRKDLALLGWDAALVQEAVTTLLGTVVYAAPLDALPPGITLPPSMRFEAPAEGEPGPGRLLCTGPMSASQRAALTRVPPRHARVRHRGKRAAPGAAHVRGDQDEGAADSGLLGAAGGAAHRPEAAGRARREGLLRRRRAHPAVARVPVRRGARRAARRVGRREVPRGGRRAGTGAAGPARAGQRLPVRGRRLRAVRPGRPVPGQPVRLRADQAQPVPAARAQRDHREAAARRGHRPGRRQYRRAARHLVALAVQAAGAAGLPHPEVRRQRSGRGDHQGRFPRTVQHPVAALPRVHRAVAVADQGRPDPVGLRVRGERGLARPQHAAGHPRAGGVAAVPPVRPAAAPGPAPRRDTRPWPDAARRVRRGPGPRRDRRRRAGGTRRADVVGPRRSRHPLRPRHARRLHGVRPPGRGTAAGAARSRPPAGQARGFGGTRGRVAARRRDLGRGAGGVAGRQGPARPGRLAGDRRDAAGPAARPAASGAGGLPDRQSAAVGFRAVLA
ncbi:hypothetical protein [Actinomadura sp. 9N215]|uniref:hypothetical protein n=1 Tax=Actinomadura sp. 9N215 TaxID=3375150 RepID=UPI0037BDA792